MEEQEWIVRQVLESDVHDLPRASEPCVSVPNAALGLEAPGPQPLIGESETGTAMVVLSIIDPSPASILENRAVFRDAVWDAREKLRQVECGIRVVADSEEKHLPVRFPDPANRTFGDVGRERKWIGGEPGRLGSRGREGVEVIAARYTGQSPECIRDDPEVGRRWSAHWVEGFVVISRPGRHHQRAIGTEGSTERLDHAERSSLDRPCGPE
jgi:hypothetical protein